MVTAREPGAPDDALSKIGTQLIRDAERRQRARRRRTRAAVSIGLTTLSMGGVVTAAGVDDIAGQPSGPVHAPNAFRPSDDARVDLTVSDGLRSPWTFTAYRSRGEGFCAAVAPSGTRAQVVQCGAAVVTDEELSRRPVTSVSAVAVGEPPDSPVLVVGFARPDATRVAAGGVGHDLTGPTVSAPIERFTNVSGHRAEIRPFAFVLPSGTVAVGDDLELAVRTDGSGPYVHPTKVVPR